MIQVITTYKCRVCGSEHIVKNGTNKAGNAQYHCKDCGVHTTTDDAARERAAKEVLVEKLHLERVSQRGIARLSGMSRSTIIKRLKKDLPSNRRKHNSVS